MINCELTWSSNNEIKANQEDFSGRKPLCYIPDRKKGCCMGLICSDSSPDTFKLFTASVHTTSWFFWTQAFGLGSEIMNFLHSALCCASTTYFCDQLFLFGNQWGEICMVGGTRILFPLNNPENFIKFVSLVLLT